MQLEGEYRFGAPVTAVWDALMDPAVLTQALPGGEGLSQVGENQYEAVMNVRVGPVQGRFDGRIELSDIVEHQAYRMKVSGQGAPGFVSGEGDLRLEAVVVDGGADETLLRYVGAVQVGGKIAGVSQRLVESSAKSLTRQGLQALERQIAARLAAESAPVEVPVELATAIGVESAGAAEALPPPAWQPVTTGRTAATAPRTSAGAPTPAGVMLTTARDVASDLASDYIPPAQQEKVFWAAVGAAGMLLFVVLVRLVQKR